MQRCVEVARQQSPADRSTVLRSCFFYLKPGGTETRLDRSVGDVNNCKIVTCLLLSFLDTAGSGGFSRGISSILNSDDSKLRATIYGNGLSR